MSRSLFQHLSAALVGVALLATPALAANKEHQQMMADIRMLQEQQQRLQLQLAALADTLKTITAKLDENANTNRKMLADQKLTIDNIVSDLRVVGEKASDTNSRLGSLAQDVEAIHQGLVQGAAAGAAGAPPVAGAAGNPPSAGGVPPTAPPPTGPPAGGQIGVLPSQLFQEALSDYRSSQWDLAIKGFEQYLALYPKAPDAPDAQLLIGDSNRLAGRFNEAIAAYTKVINNYPSSTKVPEAYYRRGQTYEAAGDKGRARQDYDYLIKTYPPDNTYVLLARQRIQGAGQDEDEQVE